MLYKDLSLGGNVDEYKTEEEAARFNVKAEKLAKNVETLTFSIAEIADDNKNATISMAWEDVKVKFNVSVDYDEMVTKSIETNTKVNPGNYAAAANYYLENGKDLKQALEWINLAISQGNPNAFWNIHMKAKIQKALGDKKGAIETAQKSIEIAKKSGNDFGYVKLNEDLIKSLK
jgi:tetratricopeptide (TPR) repeat protein